MSRVIKTWAGFSRSGSTGPTFRATNSDYTAAEESGGNYLVKANLTQSEANPSFIGLAPIYAEMDGRTLLIGRARITGNSTLSDLKLRVPRKPKRVLINANDDVLARK